MTDNKASKPRASIGGHRTIFGVKVLLLSLPGLAGFIYFYILPFGKSIWYSTINDTFNKEFVGADNYISVLGNQYYRLALTNTFLFSLIGVALLVLLSLFLTFILLKLTKHFAFIKSIFILPMVLPTAGIIYVWRTFFYDDTYYYLMKDTLFSSFFQVLPIYLIFLWKNVGINIILLTAAVTQIPGEIMESASLDGAKTWTIHRKISLPLMMPTVFFVGVLSFVNSLKIFKESYLFFGTNYPPDSVYTVQYYMNNHFNKLNYQNLTAGSLIFTLIIAFIIFAAYRLQNRFTDHTM